MAPAAPSSSWWPSPDPTGWGASWRTMLGPRPLEVPTSLRVGQPLSRNVEYRSWTWAGGVGMAWTHPMKGENGPSRD